LYQILWFLYCVLYSGFVKGYTVNFDVWMVSVLWTPLFFSVWQLVYRRHYYFWCPNSGLGVQWTPLYCLVSKPSVPWIPLVIGVQTLSVLWTIPQTFSVLWTLAFLVSKHLGVQPWYMMQYLEMHDVIDVRRWCNINSTASSRWYIVAS